MVIPTQRSGADEVAQNYFINVNPCKNVAMYSLMVYFIYYAIAIILDFLYNIKHSNEISPISKIELRDT